MRWVLVGLMVALVGLGLGVGTAAASILGDRLGTYPAWTSPPPIAAARGDLVYPDWFAGTWQATTTLVDLQAPLAPALTTPGFEANRQSLEQPVRFEVRFIPAHPTPQPTPRLTPRLTPQLTPRLTPRLTPFKSLFPQSLFPQSQSPQSLLPESLRPEALPPSRSLIVADRAFNGFQIAQAYLGEDAVRSVEVAPENPNQQLTTLRNGHQLVSLINGRRSEMPEPDHFLTSEMFQQVFRGAGPPYLNRVETTTDYRRVSEQAIAAEQITAIYLSPQDPDYFKAGDRPVALYRYHLQLHRPLASSSPSPPR